MVVYDIKDSVSTCKHRKVRESTCRHLCTGKMQVVTPKFWHSCVLFAVGIVNLIFDWKGFVIYWNELKTKVISFIYINTKDWFKYFHASNEFLHDINLMILWNWFLWQSLLLSCWICPAASLPIPSTHSLQSLVCQRKVTSSAILVWELICSLETEVKIWISSKLEEEKDRCFRR